MFEGITAVPKAFKMGKGDDGMEIEAQEYYVTLIKFERNYMKKGSLLHNNNKNYF